MNKLEKICTLELKALYDFAVKEMPGSGPLHKIKKELTKRAKMATEELNNHFTAHFI